MEKGVCKSSWNGIIINPMNPRVGQEKETKGWS